jgi:hypothetical protein
MTTETIQGNKLIAEFMGFTWDHFPNEEANGWWRAKDLSDENLNDPYVRRIMGESDSLFHQSWDWLMPVVEKISLMNYPDEPEFADDEDYVPDTAYPRTFGMISRNGQFLVRFNRQPLFEADTLIEAAWMAVVDFVKTYNELKMSHESPHS